MINLTIMITFVITTVRESIASWEQLSPDMKQQNKISRNCLSKMSVIILLKCRRLLDVSTMVQGGTLCGKGSQKNAPNTIIVGWSAKNVEYVRMNFIVIVWITKKEKLSVNTYML